MYINFVILPFIILLGLLLPDNNKNRIIYIIIVILILSLESALRGLFLVEDTYSYYEMFTIRVPNMSWAEIWSGFINRYFGQVDEEFDFGFYVLQKAISYLTDSFQVFTFLSQLLFFVPMGILLYKYSTNTRQLVFAFVFYVALLHVSALGGGRQLLARGCWIMAFMVINDRKFIKGALWVLLGLTFHFSMLVVLLAVALSFMKARQLKILHLVAFFILPLIILFPTQTIQNLASLAGSERYTEYGEHEITGGATTFVVLLESMSVFCFFLLRKKTLDSNNLLKKLYVMLPCMTVFAPLIIADGVMIRLCSYFHLFLMLLVPYAIDEFKDRKTEAFIYTVMIGVLVFLSLKGGGLKYYFFWQDVGV